MKRIKKFFKGFVFIAERDEDPKFHITPAIIGIIDGGIAVGILWGDWIVAVGWEMP